MYLMFNLNESGSFKSFYGEHRPTLFVIVWGNLDNDNGISKSPLSDICETHPIKPFLYLPIVFISIAGKPPERKIVFSWVYEELLFKIKYVYKFILIMKHTVNHNHIELQNKDVTIILKNMFGLLRKPMFWINHMTHNIIFPCERLLYFRNFVIPSVYGNEVPYQFLPLSIKF